MRWSALSLRAVARSESLHCLLQAVRNSLVKVVSKRIHGGWLTILHTLLANQGRLHVKTRLGPRQPHTAAC